MREWRYGDTQTRLPPHQTPWGGYQKEEERNRDSPSHLRRRARRRRKHYSGHDGRCKAGERQEVLGRSGAEKRGVVEWLTLTQNFGVAHSGGDDAPT
jgi:hypothetical protein